MKKKINNDVLNIFIKLEMSTSNNTFITTSKFIEPATYSSFGFINVNTISKTTNISKTTELNIKVVSSIDMASYDNDFSK